MIEETIIGGFSTLKDLAAECISYRLFYEEVRVSKKELRKLVGLARLTALTSNYQALKFRICNTEEENKTVFGMPGWASAPPDWDAGGPWKWNTTDVYWKM